MYLGDLLRRKQAFQLRQTACCVREEVIHDSCMSHLGDGLVWGSQRTRCAMCSSLPLRSKHLRNDVCCLMTSSHTGLLDCLTPWARSIDKRHAVDTELHYCFWHC